MNGKRKIERVAGQPSWKLYFTATTMTLALVFVSNAHAASGQQGTLYTGNPDKRLGKYGLDDKIKDDIVVSSQTMKDFFLREPAALMLRIRPAVGFEMRDPARKSDERISLSLKRMTLRAILDRVVAQDSDYVWALSGGVINVRMRESGLNKRLPSFKIQGLDAYEALEVMLIQIDANDWHFAANRARQNKEFVDQLRRAMPRLYIDLSNPTIYDCLNAIVAQDGLHDWLLDYDGTTGKKTIGLKDKPWFRKVVGKELDRQTEERWLKEGFTKTPGGRLWIKGVDSRREGKKSKGKKQVNEEGPYPIVP